MATRRISESEEHTALGSAEFIALYERYHRSVFGYVARRLGSDAAEEITAQTFAEAWASRDRFDSTRGTPILWFLGIATNLIRKHDRVETRQLLVYAATGFDPVDPMDETGMVNRLAARDDLRTVAAVIAEMDRDTRDVLFLWAAADLSYQEISDTLDMPIGTVRSKLFRARKKLAESVDPTDIIDSIEDPAHG